MDFKKLKKLLSVAKKVEPLEKDTSLIMRHANPEEFQKAIADASKINPNIPKMISDYTPEDLARMKLRLSEDNLSGYAVKSDSELTNLFSGPKARGSHLMDDALREGASKLDHFDNPVLNKLYDSKGFQEINREKNWVPGEPDVIYRKRKQD